MIIDLDAHRGDGHEADALHLRLGTSDPSSTFILDCYGKDLFPGEDESNAAINRRMYFKPKDTGATFLRELRTHLPAAMAAFAPDLVIYNAGTDPLEGDPLAGLNISEDAMVERDQVVFEACGFPATGAAAAAGAGARPITRGAAAASAAAPTRFVPLVYILSGGYQKKTAALITRSLTNVHASFSNVLSPTWQRPDLA